MPTPFHTQAGNPERCCEVLVQLGDWTQALALAPLVSIDYWRMLSGRRASKAAADGAPVPELLPMFLAAGKHEEMSAMLQV